MALVSGGHTARATRSFRGAELVLGTGVMAGEDGLRRDGEELQSASREDS